MINMMDSTYLEPAGEGAPLSEVGDGQVQGDYPWIGSIDATAMSYPGLDASPYVAASPTPLHSPETPILDQPVFPSPMGDFAYLDRPYGDFLPVSYPIGGVSQGLFPFRLGHRGSTTLSDRYDIITSAPSTSLYSSVGAWPTHASPTSFLPTPPTADDLSQDSAPEDDEERSSSEEPPKRKRPVAGSKAKKRPRTQLRTASRAPKKSPNILPQRPTETVEDVKARAAHNQVEQQYRKRLNLHFERLLVGVPAPRSSAGGRRDGIGERRVSKAEVLDLATERIQVLEREMSRLERERRELRVRLGGCVILAHNNGTQALACARRLPSEARVAGATSDPASSAPLALRPKVLDDIFNSGSVMDRLGLT
ncbi:hypothetical protein G7Z17_g6999 [Cylindrodendrum hubeiense]|uniref:BHLH domain-containing protein n=1 Tax=Cylindrodendrum hubeiense TaxID=595255 RepID=A0A9P5LFR3_9HYPO|nr:hypothetical protein G7Z17_g6999 [Cylindrodendrum hubeiense]